MPAFSIIGNRMEVISLLITPLPAMVPFFAPSPAVASSLYSIMNSSGLSVLNTFFLAYLRKAVRVSACCSSPLYYPYQSSASWAWSRPVLFDDFVVELLLKSSSFFFSSGYLSARICAARIAAFCEPSTRDCRDRNARGHLDDGQRRESAESAFKRCLDRNADDGKCRKPRHDARQVRGFAAAPIMISIPLSSALRT